MTGTLVNVVTIIIGGLFGYLIKRKLNHRFIEISFQVIGIFTLLLGFLMGIKTNNPLIQIVSVLSGAWIGEWINLEGLTQKLEKSVNKTKTESKFFDGLITAFLLFCIGSMTIVGALEEGINGKADLLIIKSVMDGISSVALVSAFGLGVIYSVIPLFLYQGSLTLFGDFLSQFISQPLIDELSSTGGILLIGVGLSVLNIKKIRVINMLPSLLTVILVYYLIIKLNLG